MENELGFPPMTLRDYFAAKAMQAGRQAFAEAIMRVAIERGETPSREQKLEALASIAKAAYAQADAMLEARNAKA